MLGAEQPDEHADPLMRRQYFRHAQKMQTKRTGDASWNKLMLREEKKRNYFRRNYDHHHMNNTINKSLEAHKQNNRKNVRCDQAGPKQFLLCVPIMIICLIHIVNSIGHFNVDRINPEIRVTRSLSTDLQRFIDRAK